MKSNVLTIMKKEFARFFGDKRMLTMLLLPGIFIYGTYSFLGASMHRMLASDTEYKPKIYMAAMPDSQRGSWEWAELLQIGTPDIPDVYTAKEKIAAKEADLCVIFPPDFDELVAAYDVRSAAGPAPNIEVYYNSTDLNSQTAFGTALALFDDYEYSLSNKFDINRDTGAADLATEEDTAANLISSLLPMLIIIFLYSGCMAIAPESIAGEKERGTIGALLVSPLRRSQLAVGKILSLGVLAFLSGLVTALATILALPKLMVGTGGMEEGLNVSIYGAQEYFLLTLVILTTILLLVTLISILSTFAKTVKEATTAVTPLMFVVILIGTSAVFSSGAPAERIFFIIPVYNSVQSMGGVFSLDYSAVNVALAGISNLFYACVGGFILTKMFNSEKVMFSR